MQRGKRVAAYLVDRVAENVDVDITNAVLAARVFEDVAKGMLPLRVVLEQCGREVSNIVYRLIEYEDKETIHKGAKKIRKERLQRNDLRPVFRVQYIVQQMASCDNMNLLLLDLALRLDMIRHPPSSYQTLFAAPETREGFIYETLSIAYATEKHDVIASSGIIPDIVAAIPLPASIKTTVSEKCRRGINYRIVMDSVARETEALLQKYGSRLKWATRKISMLTGK
jgi:hypothetical protein